MRCTVRKEIQEAVAAYEDKPRDQWLFDYPAQVDSHPKIACTEDYMKGNLATGPHAVSDHFLSHMHSHFPL